MGRRALRVPHEVVVGIFDRTAGLEEPPDLTERRPWADSCRSWSATGCSESARSGRLVRVDLTLIRGFNPFLFDRLGDPDVSFPSVAPSGRKSDGDRLFGLDVGVTFDGDVLADVGLDGPRRPTVL